MKKSKKGAMAAMLMKTSAMGGLAKHSKPSLHVSAHMDSLGMPDDSKYHREEVKRLRQEVKAIEREIKNWNAEAVASRALKSLQVDLASKRARLAESKAHVTGFDAEKSAEA